MRNLEYKFISKRCNGIMRKAIEQFARLEVESKKRSRPTTLFTRIREVIDPAWTDYSKIADTKTPFGYLIKVFSPSKCAKQFGFFSFENWCIDVIRNIGYVEDLPKNKALLELRDTIAELRSFAIWCGHIKSKFKPVANKNQSRNFNIQNAPWCCRVCEASTELRVFAENPRLWVNDDFIVRRPSKIYCSAHRPQPKNERKLNPAYQKYLRQADSIERERTRLYRQSFSWHDLRAESGHPYVDEFFRLIAHQNCLYPDDEAAFKRIASEIVAAHITDIKKKIIVILRTGETQTQAAERLKISQQSVSKAIAKVPLKYTFQK